MSIHFHPYGFSLIVSASRSPPGLDPKRVNFWSSFSPGSEKNPLLELMFAFGKFFGVIFGLFFEPWAHFESAEWPFLITKAAWITKGAARSKTREIKSFLGPIRDSCFNIVLICGALFLSIVFLLCSGTDLSWIVVSCRHNVLILCYTCRHLWF